MQKFYHTRYPYQTSSFYLLQEYMARPYLYLTSIFGLALLWLVAQRKDVLVPGLIGVFIIVFMGNLLGNMFARGSFLEIGFSGEYFYLRSAHDIAHKTDLKLYPLAYANAQRQGDVIMINYIEQNVKLRQTDWQEWQQIWQHLNYIPPPVDIA